MSRLDLVFHNIRDHLEALPEILEGKGIRGAARARLLRHIQREEEEVNQPLLRAALETLDEADAEARSRIALALDHSELTVDFAKGEEVDLERVKELAPHFQEEHDDGLLTAPRAAETGKREWTVGSLRKR